MTIIAWIIVGLAIGVFLPCLAGRETTGASQVAGLVGAIVGGLIGNQVFGPAPLALSWDLVGLARDVIGVLIGPIQFASVVLTAVSAAVGVGSFLLAAPPATTARRTV